MEQAENQTADELKPVDRDAISQDRKDYFIVTLELLKDKKVFPFPLFIYNATTKVFYLFLNPNAPLTKDKTKFLDYIFERGGKLAAKIAQKKTFLKTFELNIDDVPELKEREPHPLEKAQKMYKLLLEQKESKGPFDFKSEFRKCTEDDQYTPIIERVRDEVLTFDVTRSKTVSLCIHLCEKLLVKDNLTNRIVALSYMLAKNNNMKTQEILADVICTAFLHHIGLTQIDQKTVQTPTKKHGELQYRFFKKHLGLSLHLIKKSGVELSQHVLDGIGDHHERFDGSGYPHNKVGSYIEPVALIIGAVSHIFEYTMGYITGDEHPIKTVLYALKNKSFSAGLEFQFGDTMYESLITLLEEPISQA